MFLASPKENVLVRTPDRSGRVETRHDVKALRVLGPDGRVISMKLLPRRHGFIWRGTLPLRGIRQGLHRFTVEAVDYAGNLHHQLLWLRLAP